MLQGSALLIYPFLQTRAHAGLPLWTKVKALTTLLALLAYIQSPFRLTLVTMTLSEGQPFSYRSTPLLPCTTRPVRLKTLTRTVTLAGRAPSTPTTVPHPTRAALPPDLGRKGNVPRDLPPLQTNKRQYMPPSQEEPVHTRFATPNITDHEKDPQRPCDSRTSHAHGHVRLGLITEAGRQGRREHDENRPGRWTQGK